jgi:N-acyl-D-aspartate/D-glutamate deacylase
MRQALVLAAIWCTTLQGQSHVIRAGIVLDGLGNSAFDQVIRVEGGKIVWIGTSTANPDVDLSSFTVMPGWIGACLSVADSDPTLDAESKAYRLLRSGFTTVISPSTRLRDLIDDQRWAGPRILRRGDCSEAERLFEAARNSLPLTADSLVNVTSRAARLLGIADQTGTVAQGMLADLVATRGNPLEDGTALRNIVFVMKEGRVYCEPEVRKRLKLIPRY